MVFVVVGGVVVTCFFIVLFHGAPMFHVKASFLSVRVARACLSTSVFDVFPVKLFNFLLSLSSKPCVYACRSCC